jgi:hypothetical protein
VYLGSVTEHAVVDITMKRFEDMVLANDVAKVVVVYNQNYVDVTLRESAWITSAIETNWTFKTDLPPLQARIIG